MPTITGEIVALTKYNKVASAKVKTENGTTDVRWWLSAPFTDQMAEGATVTLDLEKRPQRDDPDKFDTFVASCNGVSEKGGGGNRPSGGGGGGGGRPKENPKDKTAVMLTSYAKDLSVHLSVPMDEAALAVTSAFLQIRTAIAGVVNT